MSEGFIAPGDTLLLFTDGLTEAEAHDGSLFGLDRVAALVRGARGDDPAALVRTIVETVGAEGAGFTATDDLTVLAIGFRRPR